MTLPMPPKPLPMPPALVKRRAGISVCGHFDWCQLYPGCLRLDVWCEDITAIETHRIVCRLSKDEARAIAQDLLRWANG